MLKPQIKKDRMCFFYSNENFSTGFQERVLGGPKRVLASVDPISLDSRGSRWTP